MTPQAAIEIFCNECRHRHLSENTVAAHRDYLGRFAYWCELNRLGDLREVTLQRLLDFHRWLKQKKRPDGRPATVCYQNRYIRLVKQLFKLLAGRNLIMADVGRDFPPLHDPKSLPRGIMNKDQVMRLLRQPSLTTPAGFRDRTLFETLYSTGLRGGELCKLTLYDVNLPERMLRVIEGKGRKDRVVPIGKVACSYLAEYIQAVRPILLGQKQTSVVFVTVQGEPFKTKNLRQQFMLHRNQAGLPDIITVHSLRHTCATEMLKGGASIRHVQELLGHADIQTTQIYTHVVPTDLKKAHARTAPSERRKIVEKIAFPAADDQVHWNDKRNAKYWQKLRAKPGGKC